MRCSAIADFLFSSAIDRKKNLQALRQNRKKAGVQQRRAAVDRIDMKGSKEVDTEFTSRLQKNGDLDLGLDLLLYPPLQK